MSDSPDGLRTLIVGIDGADWKIVEPMVQRGELPHLAAMMEAGAYGDLLSVYPYNSVAAWASFQSGLNPGKHGLYDFYQSGTYERGVITAEPLRGRAMWEILSEAGHRVGVMNVPITYPPRPVNGFLIPGVLTPGTDRVPTYPPGLLKGVEGYRVEPASPLMSKQVGEMDYLEALLRSIRRRGEVAVELARAWAWDFFMVAFTETDRMSHFYWKYVDAGHPAHDPQLADTYADRFCTGYRQIDAALGDLRNLAGEEALVLVVSDHGFRPVAAGVDLSSWLAERGYLAFARDRARPLAQRAYRLAQRLDVLGLRRLLPGRTVGRISRRVGRPQVDWTQTKAYPGTLAEQGIYINVKGREPGGIVAPGSEYEAVREGLIGDLMSLRDPGSGQPVVSQVWRKEEVLWGGQADLAPDLLMEPFDARHLFVSRLNDPYRAGLDVEGVYGMSGHHRREGVFIATGPMIRALGQTAAQQIVDICPTVLYAMDAPVPDDVDGKVMDQIFTDDFQASRDLRWTAAPGPGQPTQGTALQAKEEEQVRERLQGLGYL